MHRSQQAKQNNQAPVLTGGTLPLLSGCALSQLAGFAGGQVRKTNNLTNG